MTGRNARSRLVVDQRGQPGLLVIGFPTAQLIARRWGHARLLGSLISGSVIACFILYGRTRVYFCGMAGAPWIVQEFGCRADQCQFVAEVIIRALDGTLERIEGWSYAELLFWPSPERPRQPPKPKAPRRNGAKNTERQGERATRQFCRADPPCLPNPISFHSIMLTTTYVP